MNFQQLRIVHETVRRNFNLTEVAAALFTSQSGVSKHIKDLEDELGLELFVRKGKRLLGLTEPGEELAVVVDRMLMDARNIKGIAAQFSNKDHGQLTIATTHTQARYALPRVVTRFKQAYPKVHLVLHQASPNEIATMLQDGRADIGIATETLAEISDCVSFGFYGWHHSVIVPAGHPLEGVTPLTLEAIARHPLITYDFAFTGRNQINKAFLGRGLKPNVVLTAIDSDIIKTYVGMGLGVGILARMAYDAAVDKDIGMLDAAHLFESSTTRIGVRRNAWLRGYVYAFIEYFAPHLTRHVVDAALAGGGEDPGL